MDKKKIVIFANSVDQDEVVHHEPSVAHHGHLKLIQTFCPLAYLLFEYKTQLDIAQTKLILKSCRRKFCRLLFCFKDQV